MFLHRLTKSDWIMPLLGAFLLFEAARGLRSGSTIFFYRTVNRSEDGILFWASLSLSAVLGIAGILTFIF